jgi:hypothetical protein
LAGKPCKKDTHCRNDHCDTDSGVCR